MEMFKGFLVPTTYKLRHTFLKFSHKTLSQFIKNGFGIIYNVGHFVFYNIFQLWLKYK
jgi:hypothetical protein